jgi:hypothetical protein
MQCFVIPYVVGGLAPETRALAEQQNAELIDVTGDETGYWALLRHVWAAGEGFITCEQDVLPTAAQLEALANCTEAWCTSAYPYAFNTHDGVKVYEASTFSLGSAKFSTALLAKEPDLFSVGRLAQPVRWISIDGAFGDALSDRGNSPHRHAAVRHLRAEAMLGTYPMLDA